MLDDGGIKVVMNNPTTYVYYRLCGGYYYNKIPIPNWMQVGKTYTVSSNISSDTCIVEVYLYKEDGTEFAVSQASPTFTIPEGYAYFGIFLIPILGVTSTFTIYPMLNEGNTALPYEPYFEGLRDTKTTALKSEGANLLPFPYYDPTITRAGITFTVNADRGITINGSNDGTANSFIYLVWRKPFKAGDYCLSIKNVNGLDAVLYDRTAYHRIKNTVVTLPQDVDEVNIYLQIPKGSTAVFDNETIYPMLAHAPMEYKPYVGTIDTLAIPEAVRSLDGYGQGKSDTEYNFIDLINKTFPKEYGKVRLPSTAGGYNADNNWYYIGVGIGIAPISRDVLCNLLPSVDIAAYPEAEGIYMNSSLSHIILRKRGFTTQEEYRQWLADNEVYIIERLAEPVITDISEYLTDEFIAVEGNGPITAVNEHGEGVPTSVTYLIETVGG
jgi:hypothetical protein